MSALVIVPAIDLRAGRVVRLKEGRPEDETRYSSDPVAVAREFEVDTERAKADVLEFVTSLAEAGLIRPLSEGRV